MMTQSGTLDSDAQTLSLAGNTLSLTSGGSVTLPAASVTFATPAETIAGTSTTLAVNPADLYARENIAAQTGLGLVLSAIPAPTASQSNWGVNTLGETLHYMPGVGWKIIDDKYGEYASVSLGGYNGGATITVVRTAPRTGILSVSCSAYTDGATAPPATNDVFCMLAVSGYTELPIYDRDLQSYTYNPATSGSVSRLAVNAGNSLVFMFRLDAPTANVWRYNYSFQYV